MKGKQTEHFLEGEGETGKKCKQELQSVWVCKAVDFLTLFGTKKSLLCLSKTMRTPHVTYT